MASFPDSINEILQPGESAQDLADLRATWVNECPGTSYLIETLRDDLIRADWARRRARTLFHQLELDLYLTGLPMPYWDRVTQQQFRFLEKHLDRRQQEFRKALRFLYSLKQPAAKAEPPPAPAPPQPVRQEPKGSILHQNAFIKVIDGKTVTKLDKDQHFFLRDDVKAGTYKVMRHYYFENKQVPPEYEHILEHNGVYYGPTQSVYIFYMPKDFWEVCQRELDTKAEILIDGKRCQYHRNRDNEPMERPAKNETNQEENETIHPS